MNNTVGFLRADCRRSIRAGGIFFAVLAVYGIGSYLHKEIQISSPVDLLRLAAVGLFVSQVASFGGRLFVWYMHLKFEKGLSIRNAISGPFSPGEYENFAADLSRRVKGKRRS
jgi:hypothetical protein